jgi:hypothetical protein
MDLVIPSLGKWMRDHDHQACHDIGSSEVRDLPRAAFGLCGTVFPS